MYELLLRTETLFQGLQTPVLGAVGIGATVVGLVLWLGGTRYHAAIIGVLGAVVGSAAGLLVSQQLTLSPWLCMVVGAAVLGGLSVLLRNVLILVLAVLVFSAVSGTGYLAVILDRAVPPTKAQAQDQQRMTIQYFSGMDRAGRMNYMNDISHEAPTFAERLKALLSDTWQAAGPHGWMLAVAVLAGAVVGILLVWLIAKIVIALAYSLVGTALLFLGVQATLLAVGVALVSHLEPRRGLLPIAFVTMTVLGWVWQLFYAGARKPRKESPAESEPSD
jgi:F0F1-type ATP synthase assembly protein I